MATQAAIVAPTEIACGVARSAVPTQEAPSPRIKVLRDSLGVFAFVGVVATVEAIVPRFRFLLWQLPYFLVAFGWPRVLNYLRQFHPGVLPTVFDPASPLLRTLRRIRLALAWTFFGTILMGFAALAEASSSASCTCEDHPALLIGWIASMVISGLGYLGIAAYIGVRTPVPIARSMSSWPAARRSVSEYKRLESEHWGEPRDSGVTQV
jgi:hypothetical protein